MNTASVQTNMQFKIASQALSPKLLSEIESALRMIRNFGSVEIYVQNNIVTQITVRNIKKTSVGLDS